MKYIKLFEEYDSSNNITLYHGTCLENAYSLIKNGWEPNKINSGSNQGNPLYLYLTTEIEDAKWFANEKGCDTIVEVSNIPINSLIFDPEDGDGDIFNYNIKNAINKINNGYKLPIKLALTKPLKSPHFKILN